MWIERDGQFVLGEGGLGLLEGIARWHSLSRAAKHVGWSYRHAWGYVRNAERTLGLRLTAPQSGKGAARGMTLTVSGEGLLARVTRARERARRASL